MKDLDDYLRPLSEAEAQAQGAADVLAMMRRHAAKQKAKG